MLAANSVQTLFRADGDVDISLNAEGGVFFGPVHVVVFSVQLASDELINFDTAIYPGAIDEAPLIDPHTIYIDGSDSNQNIHVYTTQTVTNQIRNDEIDNVYIVTTYYQTIVDYGDRQDVYDLGYVADDLVNHTSRYFFDPTNEDPNYPVPGQPFPITPDYDLIAIRPKDGGGDYRGDQTITIDPSAIGGIVVEPNGATPEPDPGNPGNPMTVPLNAALVGGDGDDTFINHGTGLALLVGNGGSNDLEGGTLEYGNYVDSNPTGGPTAIAWPFGFTEPGPVKDEMDQSQATDDKDFNQYVSTGQAVPGVGANVLVGTTGNNVLVGGPRGNLFEGDGGRDTEYGGAGFDTYLVPGNDPGQVTIYSAVQDYTNEPGYFLGLFAEEQQALFNADELDVVYDESGTTPSFFPPAPPEPTPVTIDTLGYNLLEDSDVAPKVRPVRVQTPSMTIDASGLARLDLGGVDVATYSSVTQNGSTGDSPYYVSGLTVDNISDTTVHSIEVSPNPLGQSASSFLSGTEKGGDQFDVNSAEVPARNVTVPTVPHAPTTIPDYVTPASGTIPAHESTTVTLNPADTFPFTPALTLTIDNIRPQDSLTLDGGGGGDNYVVNLSLSATFYTSIQDSSEKGLDTLFINGGAFDRQLPVRVPASLAQRTVAQNGAIRPFIPVSIPASPGQYAQNQFAFNGAAQVAVPILLAGGYLGRTPISFSPQLGATPAYQASVIYTSPHNVEYESDLYQSAILQQQSTLQVGFNDNVKFLKVDGLDIGNTFDVTGLSALVTTLFGSDLGDVYNVGGASGDNRPKTGAEGAAAGRDIALTGIIDGLVGSAFKAERYSTIAGVVAKNLSATLDLGRGSAFLGAIDASLFAALSAGRKLAASGRAGAVIGLLNANLGPLLSAIDFNVFVGTQYQKLYLDGDAGNDVTNVSDFTGQLFINGFAGADVVNLGTDGNSGATGTASLINGTVNIGNKNGVTTLNVNDSADTAVRDVQIRSTSVIGLGPAIITYLPNQLAALNIVGTTGFQPGFFSGRLASLPRGNTYDVLSTPGANNEFSLVQTTLTVLGSGGDTVSVLATSNKDLPDKGVQGPLQIISPNHETDLRIYGYVAPANASRPRGGGAISVLNANGTNAKRVLKAMRSQSTNLFASLERGATAARAAHAAALGPRSIKRAKTAVTRKTSRSSPADHITLPPSLGPITTGRGGISVPPSLNLIPIIIDQDRVSGLTGGDITYGADELTSLMVSTPAGNHSISVVGTPDQGAVGSTQTSLIEHGRDEVYVGQGSLERVRGTLNITNPPSLSSLIVDGSRDSGSQNATVSPRLDQRLCASATSPTTCGKSPPSASTAAPAATHFTSRERSPRPP